MSMATLEKTILLELKKVTKNNKLTKNDIMEWSTSEVKAEESETVFWLPEIGVYCAVKNDKLKKGAEQG